MRPLSPHGKDSRSQSEACGHAEVSCHCPVVLCGHQYTEDNQCTNDSGRTSSKNKNRLPGLCNRMKSRIRMLY